MCKSYTAYFLSQMPPPEAQFSLNVFSEFGILVPWIVVNAFWADKVDENPINAYPQLMLEKKKNELMI